MTVVDEESVFVREIYELLEILHGHLAELDRRPEDQEIVRDIFISLHTIKGSAAMDGYEAIAAYVHQLETVFDVLRSGKATATPPFLDAACSALEQIRSMFETNVIEPGDIAPEARDLLALLMRMVQGEPAVLPAEKKGSGAKPKLRVLIVEDDFTTRNVFPRLLETCFPCECFVAVDGAEAIAAFGAALSEKQPYDLVLMDIEMPILDGQTALKSIRALEKKYRARNIQQAKIFMTTGQDDRDNVLASFREQADAYIVKPVTREKIIQEAERTGLIGLLRARDGQ